MRSLLTTIFLFLLKSCGRSASFRYLVAWWVRNHCFEDIGLSFQTLNGITLKIRTNSEWECFEEVFVQGEYDEAIDPFNPPKSWLDLGAFRGHFSVYLASLLGKHRKSPDYFFVVDPDDRALKAVEEALEQSSLQDCERYLIQAAVLPLGTDDTVFHRMKEGMGSSVGIKLFKEPGMDELIVPRLDETRLLDQLGGRHLDLIKVDVEGAECWLLQDYQKLLKMAKCVVLEWHGNNHANWTASEFESKFMELGFVRSDSKLNRKELDGISYEVMCFVRNEHCKAPQVCGS